MATTSRKAFCPLTTNRSSQSGPVPPATPEDRAAGPSIHLTFDGLEVTQSIQNMAHAVPLVAAKRTVARVYLGATAPGPIVVQGVLLGRRTAPPGPWQPIAGLAPVTIDPAENGQLRSKRENESKSLNFLLPASLCAAGGCELKLGPVFQTTPFKPLLPPAAAKRAVRFLASPPLRVRIIGVRFNGGTPPVSFEPNAIDFELIRSWLHRAYPVASVTWSQVTVDALQPWPFDAATINAFIRGIRVTDVLGGVDARTHYYGLVSDGNGPFFMRGLASGIPGVADPSTVASGPTGSNTWGWDTDGSYGDWYTGHELGHTFGRFHAEFCGAGGGAPYPFTDGQLSNADGAFVGFDVGDPSRGLPPRALPGTAWHDVMTYCESQWLSSFTYEGIRDRLVQEDALPAGAAPGAQRAGGKRKSMRSSTGAIHIVATLNLTKGTGQLRHVTAVPSVPAGRDIEAGGSGAAKRRGAARARAGSTPAVLLRLYDEADRLIAEVPATPIPDACRDPGDDETAAVDILLAASKRASRLEMVLNGTVVDTFIPAAEARAVRNITAVSGTRRRARAARSADESQESERAVITWTEPGGSRTSRSARSAQTGSARVYTVEVSTDGGGTWQTVGFGLREPQVTIDRRALGDADDVRVRITSNDGFRSVSTERKFKARDL